MLLPILHTKSNKLHRLIYYSCKATPIEWREGHNVRWIEFIDDVWQISSNLSVWFYPYQMAIQTEHT